MTLDTFFKNFDQFADAPNAVAKMRELVLQLAVQGKLSTQLPGDAPVSELCESLSRARHKQVKSRVLKAGIGEPNSSKRPFTAPRHWAWVLLNEIGRLSGGMTPSKTNASYWDGDVNWFSSRDIKSDELTESGLKITSAGLAATRLQLYPPGCLFMVARSGILKHTFPVSINRVEGAANQDLKVLMPFVIGLENYLQIMFRGMNEFIITSLVKTGMTVQSLVYEEFEKQPFPLPPLAEQKRIVAKVDELMALCDRLEAQQQERDEQSRALALASLARFAEAPTPANLNLLFHKSYSIPPADLRKSILTLAIQGKLVPQNSGDENFQNSFGSISKHDGKVQKSPKWSVPIKKDEKPFCLPNDWKWYRLGELSELKHGYAFSSQFFTSEPAPFVLTTPGNFFEGGGFRDRESKRKYYNGPVDQEFVFKPGDLIIPMTEQAAGLLGSPAFIPDDGRKYLHNQRLGKMTFDAKAVLPEFAFWFFNSVYFRGELSRTCTGMKVRHTSPDRVLRVLFPVCPLSEQRQIVAKVDQLMALVNQLETQFAASRATAKNLIESLVAEVSSMTKVEVIGG